MDIYDYSYTYSELLDKIKSYKDSDFSYPEKRRSVSADREFTSTDSFKESVELASYGWKDSNAIKDIAYNLQNLIPVSQFKDTFLYDVAGDEPEITRYLANEPENMLVFTQEEDLDHKQIHLLVNCGYSGGIPHDVIYNRGAVVVTLISKLEDLGYRVKLDICEITKSSKGNIVKVLIQMKDYNEQIDIDRIAFCLCHPSFLRRILFSLYESFPKNIVIEFGFLSGGDYGEPSDYIKGYTYTLYLPCLHYNYIELYSSMGSCIRTIQNQIAEILHKKNSY